MKFTAAMILAFAGAVSAWPATLAEGCYEGKCVQECLADPGMDNGTCFSTTCGCDIYAKQDKYCDENLGFALAGAYRELGCGDEAWAKWGRIHRQRKAERARMKEAGEAAPENPADAIQRAKNSNPRLEMHDGVITKIYSRQLSPSSSSEEEKAKKEDIVVDDDNNNNITVPPTADEKCLRECVATCLSNTGMDAQTCAGNCDCFDGEAWKDAHPFDFHQFFDLGDSIHEYESIILTDEQKAEIGFLDDTQQETPATQLPDEEAWEDANPSDFTQFMDLGDSIHEYESIILTDEQKAEIGFLDDTQQETPATHLPDEAISIIKDVQGQVTPVVSETTGGTARVTQDHFTFLPIEIVSESFPNIPGMPGIVTEGIPAVPTPSMTKRPARSVKAVETEAPVA